MNATPQLFGMSLVVPVMMAVTHATTSSRSQFSTEHFDDVIAPVLGTSQFIAFSLYCYNSGKHNIHNIRTNGSQGIPYDLIIGMLFQGGNILSMIPRPRQKIYQRFYGTAILCGCYITGMFFQQL